MEQRSVRQAHNLEIVGSNPTPTERGHSSNGRASVLHIEGYRFESYWLQIICIYYRGGVAEWFKASVLKIEKK